MTECPICGDSTDIDEQPSWAGDETCTRCRKAPAKPYVSDSGWGPVLAIAVCSIMAAVLTVGFACVLGGMW